MATVGVKALINQSKRLAGIKSFSRSLFSHIKICLLPVTFSSYV